MKKRIVTWLLAVSMAVSLLVLPAGAAATTRFSDVQDSYTSTAVETLRLMGVLDGYGDGTFRPDTILNRAQFCKMAVYAMDGSGELGRYSTVTIFPDVKPSHWASAYINMACKKGIISGFADGRFRPEQTVTAGQAVTILMRGLGYQDNNVGGVWPQSFMAEAQTNGLLDGTGITSAYSPLTRGQAARLFLNLFDAKTGGESVLFSYSLSNEVTLTAVDGGKGTLTAGGKAYDMAHPVSSTSLTGSRGKVVLNSAGKALTFLPVSGSSGVSNAAVIIGANVSSAGLEALAGNSTYSIYKNGVPASIGALRQYDVASYSASTNSILVCDTRVSVYYENCSPSPAAPTTITVLGGTELNVLPTAMDSLAKFKPGQQMTLLLTADGQVAGAEESVGGGARANALAVVTSSGVEMICGGSLIPIGGSGSKYTGKVVSLSASKDGLGLTVVSGGAGGDLNVAERTLGGRKLAENVLIFDGGSQISFADLGQTVIRASRISYARTNWAGEVDLVVLGNGLATDVVYGRAVVKTSKSTWMWNANAGENAPRTSASGRYEDGEWIWNDGYGPYAKHDEGVNGYYTTSQTISIETPSKTYGPIANGNSVANGAFVAVTLNSSGTAFESFDVLTKLSNVSSTAWVGKTAVTFGGTSYEVPSNVPCFNADSETWVDLDTARNYGGTLNLYVSGGIVRAVEVKG